MSARMFVAASTNQTKGVANILWLAGIQGDSDMLHQYVCVCVHMCEFYCVPEGYYTAYNSYMLVPYSIYVSVYILVLP